MSVPTQCADTTSRESIIDAAAELMAAVGYDKTSIAQICKHSDLPVGSIYYHFGNKAGVLAAIIERTSQRFFATMPRPDANTALTNEQRLQRYWLSAADAIHNNRNYFTLEADLTRFESTDAEFARIMGGVNERTQSQLAAVVLPFAQELGVPDAQSLARRLARFTHTYTRGAVIESGDDAGKLRSMMDDLYLTVHSAIIAASEH